MKIFYLKPAVFQALLMGLIIGLVFLSWELVYLTVYRDRTHWEKTGAVVWEINVREKLIALTFDDGPSPTFTGQILDLLAEYQAKGTFFVIGKQAEKFPGLITREDLEGHEIGNHTHNHREVNLMSELELKEDLEEAHQVIYRIIKKNVRIFRPTSGFYDDKIVKAAQSLKYTVIIWTWSQDSRDWSKINEKMIAQKILKTVKPGSIILFHDLGGDRTNTIEALKLLLPALKAEGYQLVTVSSLLKRAKKKELL